jgi:hypothetical protein
MTSMARRRRPTQAAIGANPTLHPRAFALVRDRFPDLEWHFYAHSPDSSQAFALSAFLPVIEFPDRDLLLEQFVTAALPSAVPPGGARVWRVLPEYSDPILLGESGYGEATSVDVLLVAHDAVVAVECKFRVDARQGWGRCGQPPRLCEGFHGEGSDRKGSPAACRLEAADGHRGPRHYWRVARPHFREQVFRAQAPGDVCPFLEGYQLVRNYLFAARYAATTNRPYFGVIGVAPGARSAPLLGGVERFKHEILSAEEGSRAGFVRWEKYLEMLACGSSPAKNLAAFLSELLV